MHFPLFQIPPISRVFLHSLLSVFSFPPYFDHDAFMHHTMHVLDASDLNTILLLQLIFLFFLLFLLFKLHPPPIRPKR